MCCCSSLPFLYSHLTVTVSPEVRLHSSSVTSAPDSCSSTPSDAPAAAGAASSATASPGSTRQAENKSRAEQVQSLSNLLFMVVSYLALG